MFGNEPFDAILVLSFGGPEGPDDVLPFLENVTRGRNVPRERLEEVAEQYHLFGGVSPINDINRTLVADLQALLDSEGPELPVYWGNRNWAPYVTETVAQMANDGIRHAVAFATSAYSSYSSCRQYLEDIDRAREAVGERAPVIEKIRPYWNHPDFIAAIVDGARPLLGRFEQPPRLVFTAHSIPIGMARGCDYEEQLREAAGLVATAMGHGTNHDLVYQSRSGPPAVPWLEPDVNDHLRTLAADGVRDVLLLPIGFVADHMEVKFDLDTQAMETAGDLGIHLERAPTAGMAAGFVEMVRDLIIEHIEGEPAKAIGKLGPRMTPCPADCCAYTPQRPPTRSSPTAKGGPLSSSPLTKGGPQGG